MRSRACADLPAEVRGEGALSAHAAHFRQRPAGGRGRGAAHHLGPPRAGHPGCASTTAHSWASDVLHHHADAADKQSVTLPHVLCVCEPQVLLLVVSSNEHPAVFGTGGEGAPDVTETLKNLAINGGAIAVLGFIVRRDLTSSDRDKRIVEREESLARLQVGAAPDAMSVVCA